MRKRLRTLVILGVVVAVLAGGLSVLLLTEPAETPNNGVTTTTADPALKLLSITREESDDDKDLPPLVSAATITQGDTTFELTLNADNELYVKGYEKLPTNLTKTNSFVSNVTTVNALQKITGTGDDAAFGFDKPTATAEITYYDGTKATFTLGKEAPASAGYYFRLSGNSGTFLVSSYLATALTQPPSTYVGTVLVTAPVVKSDDTAGAAVLRDLSMEGPALDRPYSYRLVTEADRSEHAYAPYILTAPYLRTTDSNKLGQNVMSATAVTASQAVAPFPTEAHLEEYGLKTPSITATVRLAVRTTKQEKNDAGETVDKTEYYNLATHTFKIGKEVDGSYYVLVDDIDCVYLVSASQIPWAELSYEDCVTPLMFLKDIGTVSKITIAFDGKTTVFDLIHFPEEEDYDEKLVAKMDGETVDTDNFRDFYQLLMAVERAGAAPAEPTGDPVFTVTYTDAETAYVTTVDMYQHSASVYIGVFDNGDVFRIKGSEIDHLLRQCRNMREGKEVQLGR